MLHPVKHGSHWHLLAEPRVDLTFAGEDELLAEVARVKELAHPILCVRQERQPGLLMLVGPGVTAWDTSHEPLATFRRSFPIAIDETPSAHPVAKEGEVFHAVARLGPLSRRLGTAPRGCLRWRCHSGCLRLPSVRAILRYNVCKRHQTREGIGLASRISPHGKHVMPRLIIRHARGVAGHRHVSAPGCSAPQRCFAAHSSSPSSFPSVSASLPSLLLSGQWQDMSARYC